MRLILAAAALTALALPAHAQRLDTRRINMVETPTAIRCHFNAYPPLYLLDATVSNKGKTAFWSQPAEGFEKSPRFLMIFGESERGWREPGIMGIIFSAKPDADINEATLGDAKLRIGNSVFPTMITAKPDDLSFMVVGGVQRAGVAAIASDSVELDLIGKDGKVVRTYRWDTHRLEDAAETISVVGWSCTSP